MASPVQYVCWEYARDDGGYSPYHPEESYMIEKAFADNPNGRIVFSHYIIDLANRRQEGLEGAIIYTVCTTTRYNFTIGCVYIYN